MTTARTDIVGARSFSSPTAELAPPAWRSASSAVICLAVLAIVSALWAGRDFVIPVVFALTLAVLLWPLSARVARALRSRLLAALLTMALTVLCVGAMLYAVALQASSAMDRLPSVVKLVSRDVASLGTDRARIMQSMRASLEELDHSVARATGTSGTARTAAPGGTLPERRVSIVSQIVDAAGALALLASRSVAAVLLQCAAIALLTFFLLVSGDVLVARIARWWCARHPATAPRCVPALDEAARQVRLFARVTLISNALIGLGVALCFFAFDVPDAALWGLAAGTLHFVPYAGLLVIMALAALEVYAAQSSLLAAMLAAGCVGLIGIVVGTAITVWLQGRAAKIDNAVLFGGTLFWAVLWGGWGLVLGPLMVVAARLAWRESAAVTRAAAAPADDTAAHHAAAALPSRAGWRERWRAPAHPG